MKTKKPSNLAASVRQQLLNRAKARGEDFNFTLSRYAIERFLYRLAQSAHHDRFVLKGANLFSLWTRDRHRATWDLDLMARGATVREIEKAVREICAAPVEDDGLLFDAASVRGELIRDDQEYQGVRTRLVASIGEAKIPVQVDVGFGDAVIPPPRLERGGYEDPVRDGQQPAEGI